MSTHGKLPLEKVSEKYETYMGFHGREVCIYSVVSVIDVVRQKLYFSAWNTDSLCVLRTMNYFSHYDFFA